MKKILAAILALVMITAIFASCGASGGSAAGKYYTKSVNGQPIADYYKTEAEEAGVDLEKFCEILGITADHLNEFMTIELKDDGSAVVNSIMSGEEDEPSTGTWTQEGSKIIITVDDEPQEFKYENGQLIVSIDEDLELVLEK